MSEKAKADHQWDLGSQGFGQGPWFRSGVFFSRVKKQLRGSSGALPGLGIPIQAV